MREHKQATAKYKGMTKKKYKKKFGSSTDGIVKNENCKASPLKKGIMKYPRWYKKDPVLYREMNAITDKLADRKTVCGGTLVVQ